MLVLTKSPGSEVEELCLSEGGEGGESEGEAGRGEGPREGGLWDVGDESQQEEHGQGSQYLGASHLPGLPALHCANFGWLLHL